MKEMDENIWQWVGWKWMTADKRRKDEMEKNG